MKALKKRIRNIQDFPQKGIQFKDITTLLSDPASFQRAIDLLAHRHFAKGVEAVVGVEARGFVMGAAMAYKLGIGVILVRKHGKLPYKTVSAIYDLEYGKDRLEIHEDAVRPGMRVIVADDVLATGGTMAAVVGLLERLGAEIVECCFLAELTGLKGRDKLKGQKVFSLLKFTE
ncbi:MAG: adenine phosphoribosyltransferase [Deltaproteobacteria bacterium RBG_19FT_COMBO_60_16]|jgi:adenine phosphoribosyltransferase|nr:MAG: adenine phosphoribosyltransferase [Deltaproteobacteria bacterium RBG_16_64_85]OGP99904.1 MAG: adenine phosphoribosyltransferase [Deltaproteobacteria bacterium RBG_19FT_COMBO_60_16]